MLEDNWQLSNYKMAFFRSLDLHARVILEVVGRNLSGRKILTFFDHLDALSAGSENKSARPVDSI